MKPLQHIVVIISAAALATIAGCAPGTETSSGRSSKPKATSEGAVTLRLVSFEPTHARMRLTNRSGRTLAWWGYGLSAPEYRLREKDLFGWHERDLGWYCGVGLDTNRLRAGQSAEFTVELPAHIAREFQIGFDYTYLPRSENHTAWASPVLTRR